MKFIKSPVAIAVLLATSCSAFAAIDPITDQEGVGEIQWQSPSTKLEFVSNGFVSDTLPIDVNADQKTDSLTITGTGSMIQQSAATLTFRGLKELNIHSTNADKQATISMTAKKDGLGNYLYLGHVQNSNQNNDYEKNRGCGQKVGLFK